MSRGWGSRQRNLVRAAARQLVPNADDKWGPSFGWERITSSQTTSAESSAIRRAAGVLEREGLLEVSAQRDYTSYGHGEVWVRRPFVHIRLPATLPSRLSPPPVGDAREQLVGYSEALLEWAALGKSDPRLVGDRAAWAPFSERTRALERRMRYHALGLERLPAIGGAFCWEWAAALWLAERDEIRLVREELEYSQRAFLGLAYVTTLPRRPPTAPA